MKIKVRRVSPTALLPTRGSSSAAGQPSNSVMQEFCHARIQMNKTPQLQVHVSIDQKGRMIQRTYLRIKEDYFQAFK